VQQKALQPNVWQHLTKIQSTMIFIRDLQTLEVVGMNNKAKQFMKAKNLDYLLLSSLQAAERHKEYLKNVSPLFLMFVLNVKKTQKFKMISMKMYDNKIGSVLSMIMHVDDDQKFAWAEVSEVNPPIWDDEFTLDEYHHPATMRVLLPAHENSELAMKMFLEVSKGRDCKMIAHFLKMNNNKFAVQFEDLFKITELELQNISKTNGTASECIGNIQNF
jgi:hypothetical protein